MIPGRVVKWGVDVSGAAVVGAVVLTPVCADEGWVIPPVVVWVESFRSVRLFKIQTIT